MPIPLPPAMAEEIRPLTPVADMKPSTFYFRRAIRGADNLEEIRELALMLCLSIDLERQWIRDQGLIPPKQVMLEAELIEKSWDAERIGEEDVNQSLLPFS